MLKKRLIPKLQLGVKNSFRGQQSVLVVTRQFGSRRAIGNPLSQAKIYESQMADELILVNLERTAESWSTLLETVEELAEELATPLTVGGGVKNIEQIQALLDRGADKIILNSGAIDQPNLIDQVANAYGAQCVVVSIDVRQKDEGVWGVWAMSGKVDTNKNALDWACEATERGAGEVMITAIDRDGTGQGLDLGITSCLTKALNVPVITSGGCGLAQHFVEGYQAGASAVAAGTFFCQRDQNPMQCRSHIRNAGLPIRLEV
tara:strand:+ start:4561 stop:5346 length:786 start_codon:yes stop_codon:yes gene_type:complete